MRRHRDAIGAGRQLVSLLKDATLVGKRLLPYYNTVVDALSFVVIRTCAQITRQRCLYGAIKQNILDSRGVVWCVVDLQAPRAFRVKREIHMHKMAYQKETVMRVWGYSPLVIAQKQL